MEDTIGDTGCLRSVDVRVDCGWLALDQSQLTMVETMGLEPTTPCLQTTPPALLSRHLLTFRRCRLPHLLTEERPLRTLELLTVSPWSGHGLRWSVPTGSRC